MASSGEIGWSTSVKDSGDRVEVPTQAFTITFGEVAENHIGQQKIGESEQGNVKAGLSLSQLKEIQTKFNEMGVETKIVDLCQFARGTEIEHDPNLGNASVLIARDGASAILSEIGRSANDMYDEQLELPKDSKFYSPKHGGVVNKHARHNLCFDDVGQEPDYENKKGTIVPFDEVLFTKTIREEIVELIDSPDTKVTDGILKAEGNYYYNPSKCGIGFHGDVERKIAVGLRLGVKIPLHYQWYYKGNPVGERCKLDLEHGDMYFMSEKAVGNDWKRRIIPTLRHAAGADSYLKIAAKKDSSVDANTSVAGKVKNPITGRQIMIGKGVYNTLIEQGYVMENGELVFRGDAGKSEE
jgi:hypothetical protein